MQKRTLGLIESRWPQGFCLESFTFVFEWWVPGVENSSLLGLEQGSVGFQGCQLGGSPFWFESLGLHRSEENSIWGETQAQRAWPRFVSGASSSSGQLLGRFCWWLMTQRPISEEPNGIGKKPVPFFFSVNLRVLIINFFKNQSLFTSYERSIAVISKMKDHSRHPHLVSFSSSWGAWGSSYDHQLFLRQDPPVISSWWE